MPDHQVVSREEWLAARVKLLAEEKEFTRRRDALTRHPPAHISGFKKRLHVRQVKGGRLFVRE